jgi:hypothetical protein
MTQRYLLSILRAKAPVSRRYCHARLGRPSLVFAARLPVWYGPTRFVASGFPG